MDCREGWKDCSLCSFLLTLLLSPVQVVRPSLNVQLAADSVAKSLNVTSGALVLSVCGRSKIDKIGKIGKNGKNGKMASWPTKKNLGF